MARRVQNSDWKKGHGLFPPPAISILLSRIFNLNKLSPFTNPTLVSPAKTVKDNKKAHISHSKPALSIVKRNTTDNPFSALLMIVMIVYVVLFAKRFKNRTPEYGTWCV